MFWNKPTAIKVTRTHELAILPQKNHTNKFADAAYDLFPFEAAPTAPLDAIQALDTTPLVFNEKGNYKEETKFILYPNHRKMVGTGIRVAIPDGYWIKFHERSGLANKGIHILGGVIDSGYTGELKVIMYNSGSQIYEHDCSKAICQFTLEKVTESKIELISNEDMDYQASLRERKDKGFGSSDGK
jgi:deoxyuridine 5'-triphosphate nucleotidohydrolase